MPPNMNPRMRYPVMENTKIKKRKTVHNIEEMNVEDEDDIPLSKLRQTDGVTDNKPDAAVTGFVTENGGMTENKEDGAVTALVTENDTIRWQEYHKMISYPVHYQMLEMEISKVDLPVIQSTLVINCYLSGDEVDRIALTFLPEDAPEGLIPIICGSDGNCFCRAVSHLIYGNEDHYMEI